MSRTNGGSERLMVSSKRNATGHAQNCPASQGCHGKVDGLIAGRKDGRPPWVCIMQITADAGCSGGRPKRLGRRLPWAVRADTVQHLPRGAARRAGQGASPQSQNVGLVQCRGLKRLGVIVVAFGGGQSGMAEDDEGDADVLGVVDWD